MTQQLDERELERRLAAWMRTAAAAPAPDFADRLFARTAATPQHRIWPAWFAIVPALGTTAVVAAAIVIGLQLGRVVPPPVGSEPATPMPSASDRSSSAPSPSGEPSSTSSAEPAPGTFRCQNTADGFTVEVRGDWYANDFVDAPEGLDDVPACRYFGSEPVEVEPNAGLPPSVAVAIVPAEEVAPPGGDVLASGETTVDGREALVREVAARSDGFLPEGTLVYGYYVRLDDGRFLWAWTDSSRGDYELNRAVLDDMMERIELDA